MDQRSLAEFAANLFTGIDDPHYDIDDADLGTLSTDEHIVVELARAVHGLIRIDRLRRKERNEPDNSVVR